MKIRLETVKALDVDAEKDGAKEIRYDKDDYKKDSYDYLFDDIDYIKKIEKIDDDDKAAVYAARTESDGIAKALAESEMPEELWSASNLGKYTINTPTQEKQRVSEQEKYMEPISDKEFQEISDEAAQLSKEMQEQFDKMAKELEGRF